MEGDRHLTTWLGTATGCRSKGDREEAVTHSSWGSQQRQRKGMKHSRWEGCLEQKYRDREENGKDEQEDFINELIFFASKDDKVMEIKLMNTYYIPIPVGPLCMHGIMHSIIGSNSLLFAAFVHFRYDFKVLCTSEKRSDF